MKILPTKRNMQMAKQQLARAVQWHNLLDKKYKMLMQTLLHVKFTLNDVKCQFENALQQTNILLAAAKAEVGEDALNKMIDTAMLDGALPYGLYESTAAVDEAFFAWQEAKVLLVKIAELEQKAQHLALQLQKVQKRAAALKNITIPQYKTHIKNIASQLEERERDELIRVKHAIESSLATLHEL